MSAAVERSSGLFDANSSLFRKCRLQLCWFIAVSRGLWPYLGLWLYETLEEEGRDG